MNKQWDKYEAALLINAYVKNKSLKPSKTVVVNKLSKKLRKRATNKGQKIDATFRNKASVDTHLTSVQRLAEGDQQARKHAGKVFVEMVDTYYDDPATFKEILSIAVNEVKPEKNTVRIPWDKYETALLIDACLQIRDGSCSRAAMISDLSHKLRERAMNLGIAIDDTYRNENGISMQLTNIQRLLQHDDGAERHVAKIFIEMVEMYENDNAAFDGILITAQRGEATVNSNMEQFLEWLSKRVPDGTLGDYRYAYSLVEQYARSRGFIQKENLIDSADAALFAEIASALKTDAKYKYESPKAERYTKEVAELLYSFTNDGEKRRVTVSDHEEDNSCGDQLVQYLDRKGLEYIDCRDRKGCLWVLGNEELLGLIEILRRAGLTFKYKKYGGYKTKGKSAWLTMDDTADFQMPEEITDGAEDESPARDPSINSNEISEKFERKRIESISLPEWRAQDGYKEFLKWMTEKGNLPGVALCYADWVANIGNYLLSHAITDEKVYSILDVSELERIKTLLSNDNKFAKYVPDNDSRFWLFALSQYIVFRKEVPSAISVDAEAVPEEQPQVPGLQDNVETQREADASDSMTSTTPELSEEPTIVDTKAVDDVSSDLLIKIEDIVLKADLDGITLKDLQESLPDSKSSIRAAIDSSNDLVCLSKRFYHKDAFVDWDIGAEQLAQITDKLMAKNNGYVSCNQLFDYARAEMQMFLNDNDISSMEMAYDLARHLFEKEGYNGVHYSFKNDTHISRLGEDQVGSTLDVVRKYARDRGGMFHEAELLAYLKRMGIKTANIHQQMKLNDQPIFLYYQTGFFITAECMNMDDAWFEQARAALHKLFDDMGDHVVLRDIQPWWYTLLPSLPGHREWTTLLLQNILAFYSNELDGARTIGGMSNQTMDTIHAMLVSGTCELQTFADAVAAWYVDDGITQKEFRMKELRDQLAVRGLIANGEMSSTLPRILGNDPRFAWTADCSAVRINL